MIFIYRKTIKDKKIKELQKIAIGSWVNVIFPTKKEIDYLTKVFKIDRGIIKDALDPDELPRIEKEKGKIYLILTAPYWDFQNKKLLIIPFLIVITKDLFITLSSYPFPLINSFFKRKELVTTQKTKNLLKICLALTQSFEKEIREINKRIYTEKINLAKLENKDIANLVETEEILNKFITSLSFFIGILEKILSGKFVDIYKDDEELTENLIVNSRQSLDMCRISIKNIVNIREAYSTILTNNLNKIIKFLTALTVIIGIPTLISSFYGMNIGLPFQNHPFAFLYISIFTLFSCLVIMLVFYSKKWF